MDRGPHDGAFRQTRNICMECPIRTRGIWQPLKGFRAIRETRGRVAGSNVAQEGWRTIRRRDDLIGSFSRYHDC